MNKQKKSLLFITSHFILPPDDFLWSQSRPECRCSGVTHLILLLTAGRRKCGSAASAEDDPLWSRYFLSALGDPAASVGSGDPAAPNTSCPGTWLSLCIQRASVHHRHHLRLGGLWGRGWYSGLWQYFFCEYIQIGLLFFCQRSHFVWTWREGFRKQMQNIICQTAICGRLWMLIMWLISRAGSCV